MNRELVVACVLGAVLGALVALVALIVLRPTRLDDDRPPKQVTIDATRVRAK